MINSQSSRADFLLQNPNQTFAKPDTDMMGRRAGYEILPLVDYKKVKKQQKT